MTSNSGFKEPANAEWFLKALLYGCVAVFILWLIGRMLSGSVGPLRQIAQSQRCQSNQSRLMQAFGIYAADNQDYLPPAQNWMKVVGVYTDKPNRFHCPSIQEQQLYGYGMVATSAGLKRDEDNAVKPLMFDSENAVFNAFSKDVELPKKGRHIARIAKGQPWIHGGFVSTIGGSIKFVPIGTPIKDLTKKPN